MSVRAVPIALLLGLVATAAAQELPFQVQGPPPGWIEPGLRLTYYTLSGELPSGPYEYVLNDKGEWADAGGNRYARKDVQGKGSHGYLQVNVVGMEKERVAVQSLFYLFDGMDASAPLQSLELGYVAPASTGGDLWIHPAALKQLLEKGATGMNILRAQYTIDLATYDAVMIHGPRKDGRSLWYYDLESGVLLYSSNVTRSTSQNAQTGEQLNPGGSTVLFSTFKSSRTVPVPWAKSQSPGWFGSLRGIDYNARFIVRQPGVADTPIPFGIGLDVVNRGADWIMFRAQVGGPSAGALPVLSDRVAGNCQLTGLWIPLAGLAGLRAGQVLDEDTMTKVVTRVDAVDDQSVVITKRGPRQTIAGTYRKSDGLCVRVVANENLNVPGMTKVVEMEFAGTR